MCEGPVSGTDQGSYRSRAVRLCSCLLLSAEVAQFQSFEAHMYLVSYKQQILLQICFLFLLSSGLRRCEIIQQCSPLMAIT